MDICGQDVVIDVARGVAERRVVSQEVIFVKFSSFAGVKEEGVKVWEGFEGSSLDAVETQSFVFMFADMVFESVVTGTLFGADGTGKFIGR